MQALPQWDVFPHKGYPIRKAYRIICNQTLFLVDDLVLVACRTLQRILRDSVGYAAGCISLQLTTKPDGV